MSISLRGIRRMMQKESSGHFTSNSVRYYKKLIEDLTSNIIPRARMFANNVGRKRVEPSDIKLAAIKWIKKRN